MRVSLNWLKELVDIDLPVDELTERLDMTGTAVESVTRLGAGLDDVVVGQVLERAPHPDADRLSYCKVDVGRDEPLDIVCGADNFAAGDRVPVALVGAVLPNGMEIKKSKIRGCVSFGMMCSPVELGLGEEASGLLILPEDAPVGMPFGEYQGIEDLVLDLEVTPNRPDCLSVAGIAREIAAVLDRSTKWPGEEPSEGAELTEDVVGIEIAEPELCPRYTARVIRGVRIGPSPEWLQQRVIASGARPINNIVDATNYVMFELGQPLHAFDLDTITVADGKSRVIVRRADDGERLTTLDGQERVLDSDMVVIADPKGAIALAGVMGGADTEVGEDTTNVLLESASFSPTHISRTSRSLGLISEASFRFEKRVDPEGCAAAADRAAALIAQIAGGEVSQGIADEYPLRAQEHALTLRVDALNRFLGTGLAADDVADLLRRLGLGVDPTQDVLSVTVPTWRPDLEREVDLFEEVVRLHGMTEVESTLPGGPERIGGLTREQRVRARIGVAARAAGLNEVTTYSFVDPVDAERLAWDFEGDQVMVRLLNPMSEEQSVLRPTIAGNLLRAVSYNQRRTVPDVHLYEVGTVFVTEPGRKQPAEREVLTGVLAGSWARPGWSDAGEPLGFFDGKGVVQTVMEELHVPHWTIRAGDRPWLQPGRSGDVVANGRVAGWLGEVHPSVLSSFDCEGPVTLFEIDVPALLAAAVDVVDYRPVPRFPSVNLDIALVLPKDVAAEQLLHAIRKEGKKLLEDVRLFDVYEGEGVPEGKRSLAVSLTYRSPERTLTDDEVQRVHAKIIRQVTSRFGGELRG